MKSKMRPYRMFVAFLSFCVGLPAVHGETLHRSVQMQVDSLGDRLDANSKGAEVGQSIHVSSAGREIVQVKVGGTGYFAHEAGNRHAHGKEKQRAASKSKFASLTRHWFGTVVRKNSTRASRAANQSTVVRRVQKKQTNQAVEPTSSKVTNKSTVVRRAPKRNQTVDMASKVTNRSTVVRRAPRRNQTVQVAVGGSGHMQPNFPGSAEHATGDMTAVHHGHAKNQSVQVAVGSTGVRHDSSEAPKDEHEEGPSAVGQNEMQHLQEIHPSDPQRHSFVQTAAGAVQDSKHHHGGRMMRRAKDHRRNGQVALGTD